MLQNWEVSGFGLTQQNRTHRGNYGEGENLRNYTFFFSPNWGFALSQGSTSWSCCLSLSSNTEFHLGGGEGKISIPGVLRVSLVLLKVLFLSSSNREEKPLFLAASLVKTPRESLQTHIKGMLLAGIPGTSKRWWWGDDSRVLHVLLQLRCETEEGCGIGVPEVVPLWREWQKCCFAISMGFGWYFIFVSWETSLWINAGNQTCMWRRRGCLPWLHSLQYFNFRKGS